ncbi:MAG TPA: zinc-dependent metalloprotease, partial [Candidatus Sulfotelmatobacter sp.]|nr:zinc-dependent metalloprotease [Candidatus Sulfotelmatobacter sp.]
MARTAIPLLLRRSLLLGGIGFAAAVSARALAKPVSDGSPRILDWEDVARIAARRSGETRRMNQSLAASLGSDYDRIAAELAPLMEEVCQSIPTERPPITVLDRQGFIDTNLTIARRLFVPLEQLRAQIPDSRASVLGRRMLNRYVGELFGFMSQRVLGQYDPVLMLPPSADPQQGEQGWSGASTGNGTSGGAQPHSLPTPSLYLVEPNVVAFERAQRADPEGLRRWL